MRHNLNKNMPIVSNMNHLSMSDLRLSRISF